MIRFAILGDLVVETESGSIPLTRQKQKALLGVLLLRPGTALTVDGLADALWGEAVPPSRRELIRTYVSQLRELLGEDAIETRHGGYAVPADTRTDAAEFRARLARASSHRAAGDDLAALEQLDAALALWRGQALADCGLEGAALIECRLLDDLRRDAVEERFAVALEVMPARELVAPLEAEVAADPARESLRGLLMIALYRAGRQAEALEAYRDARRHLGEELGIEPGPELRELEHRILNHDPSLAAPRLPASPRRPRRRGWLHAFVPAVGALAAGGALLAWSHRSAPRARAQSLAVLDGKSGRLLADVRVSAPVTAMTTGGGLVLAGTVSRTIAEIDPNRRRVVRVVGVAAAPNALAFAGNGIWVASGFGGTLTRVGLDGFELPSFRPEPRANGRLALAAQGSSVWVGSQDDELTRLDVSGRRTGSGRARHPDAMAVAYGSLWIAQATSVELLRADPETGRRSRSVPLGAPCTSIAAGAGAVWALGAEATMLWRIDPASNAVTAAIRVMPDATDVVAGTSVWVLARPTGTVEEIDPRRNAVVRTVALGRPIGGAVLADGRLWIGLR